MTEPHPYCTEHDQPLDWCRHGVTERETHIYRNRDGSSVMAAALIAVYRASQGDVTWVLDENGKRVAAIVPVDTAEFVLANLPPRHGRG